MSNFILIFNKEYVIEIKNFTNIGKWMEYVRNYRISHLVFIICINN